MSMISVLAQNRLQLIIKLRAVFEGIQNAGLEPSMAKCQFGTKYVPFFGSTIITNGVTPQIIIDINFKHAHPPTLMIRSKGADFILKRDTRNSWSPKYHTQSCENEECTNYRSLGKYAFHDKDVAENVPRRF